MFFTLLLVTFAIALAVCAIVVHVFDRSIAAILRRIVLEELSGAWQRYIRFAAYVVGISGGVRIYQLERYITAAPHEGKPLVLTLERWTLEVYRTVIEALQSLAWMFLVIFVIALLAYVLVQGFELRSGRKAAT